MDRMLHLRDAETGEMIAVMLYDNGDGTYSLAAKVPAESALPVLDPSARPAAMVTKARSGKKA